MDFTHEALKMAGAFALVVVVLLGGVAWIRRVFGDPAGSPGDPVMRILGGLRLGTGKQIMLVEMADEILVLGMTARDMTLLTTIEDRDRIHRLRTIASPVAGGVGVFLGQWTRQASGKTPAASLASKPTTHPSNDG